MNVNLKDLLRDIAKTNGGIYQEYSNEPNNEQITMVHLEIVTPTGIFRETFAAHKQEVGLLEPMKEELRYKMVKNLTNIGFLSVKKMPNE